MSDVAPTVVVVGSDSRELQTVQHSLAILAESPGVPGQAIGIARALEMISRTGVEAIALHPSLFKRLAARSDNDVEIRQLQATKLQLARENHRLESLYQNAYRFVDNVSHEFRTPLTVIKEFTSILNDGLDGPLNAQQHEHLSIVAERVNELTHILNEMFERSQIEAGKLAMRRGAFRPGEIIDRVIAILEDKAARQEVTIKVDVPNGLPIVYCDVEKLSRVAAHLVHHSLGRLSTGGQIDIRVHYDDARRQIEVRIEDDGSAIDADELDSLAHYFREVELDFRSSPRGLDLGLNIAKELVHLNLGEISVANQPDRGTRYIFTVPTADISNVANRYLERLRNLKDSELGASLIEARVDPVWMEDLADEVDLFLQHTVRCTDLVFRVDGCTWLLLAAGKSHDVTTLIERVEKQRVETNRNRPGVALPEIRLGVRNRWDFDDPDSRQDIRLEDPAGSENAAPVRPRQILLVDDDRHVVEGTAIRLKSSGFDVLTAYDGEDAIELACSHLPDAILLDIRMPAMNGLDTLRELRRRPTTRNIPVAIMSARLSDKSNAMQSGASHFIEKPYEPLVLIAAVESMTHAVTPTHWSA
jgi:hypothetical protein